MEKKTPISSILQCILEPGTSALISCSKATRGMQCVGQTDSWMIAGEEVNVLSSWNPYPKSERVRVWRTIDIILCSSVAAPWEIPDVFSISSHSSCLSRCPQQSSASCVSHRSPTGTLQTPASFHKGTSLVHNADNVSEHPHWFHGGDRLLLCLALARLLTGTPCPGCFFSRECEVDGSAAP